MDTWVLLLTHRQDFYTVDRVAEAVEARGCRPFRFDTDRFPLEVELDLSWENGSFRSELRQGDLRISSEHVRGVWLRHVGSPDPGPDVNPAFRPYCIQESRLALEGYFQSLHRAQWVNAYQPCLHGSLKSRQLHLAQEAGLRIPPTFISNGADAVRSFADRVPGDLVTKLQEALSTTMRGDGPAFYTTALSREALQDLSGLAICPQIFQERIPKDRELRVIYVDGRCFAGSVRPTAEMAVKDDWRHASGSWEEDELPAEVASRFDAFMRAMGLRFGAADFIRTPDGEFVFLEVNPCGEWGMLEKDLNLPISQAIADALLLP